MLEYNAGFTGAMAAMVEAPGSWEICLQVCAAAELIPGWVPSSATPDLEEVLYCLQFCLDPECVGIVSEVVNREASA